MIKEIRLTRGAYLEVNFDEKGGELSTHIKFDGNAGCLFSGYLYRCKNCGKFVFKSNAIGRPQLNFCDECIETMKKAFGFSVLAENKAEKTSVPKVNAVQHRGRVNSSLIRNTKVSIVVPELQQYLDLLAGFRKNSKIFNKKFVLFVLDQIARRKTKQEIAEMLSINPHTLYIYLHEMRKVALIDTKDCQHYEILAKYFIKED